MMALLGAELKSGADLLLDIIRFPFHHSIAAQIFSLPTQFYILHFLKISYFSKEAMPNANTIPGLVALAP